MISEVGFTSIFKYLPSPGLVLLPDDPDFTILAANKAYLSLCNRQEHELVGKGYFDVFQEIPDYSLSDLRASFRKVLKDKKKDFLPLRRYEIYNYHQEITDTRYLETENIPISENAGEIMYILHVISDITGSTDAAAQIKRTDDFELLEREVLELNFRKNISMEELLTHYLKGIEALFPSMQCSILRTKNGRLHKWSSPSLPREYIDKTDNLPINDNVGSCGTAAYLKEMVFVNDIESDIRWKDYKGVALKYNLRACWSYPIIDAEGNVMATFGIYYQEVKEPGSEERKIIDKATAILKIILENRQHIEKVKEATLMMDQAQKIAGFGTWSWTLETNEISWSKSLFSMYGMFEDHLSRTYDDYLKLIHKDDVKRVSTYLAEAIRRTAEINFETRIIRTDGQIRYHKTWAKLQKDEYGKPYKLIGACLDITESKQIQEKLQLSESRLRSLVDSQTNYVIRTNLDGNYTYYNKRYRDDFGWLHPEGSLLGRDSMQSVLPHHHKRVYDTAERCRLHPNKVYAVELDKYKRDGRIKSTIWHFICLTDLSGNPAEIQCIGIDNTERKRAEDELKASHKRYRELFHLSPQPMWVYEIETLRFLDVNQAAVSHYGYSKKEFLSMDLTAIRSKEEVPSLLDAVECMKGESGTIHHGIFKHKKKNGDSIYVDMRSNVITYNDKITHLALANDITERLHYVNAIEDQNRRFKAIAWMQSHVMRAPVARIMSLVDLINNHQNTEPEREELLNYILQSARELDTIVKDISEQTRH